MALDPGLTENLLRRLLHKENRSINSVLFLIENLTVTVPNFHPAAHLMTAFSIPGRDPVPESLLIRVRDAWCNRTASVRGLPVLLKDASNEHNQSQAEISFSNPVRPKLRL
jgi:hypothetical protein